MTLRLSALAVCTVGVTKRRNVVEVACRAGMRLLEWKTEMEVLRVFWKPNRIGTGKIEVVQNLFARLSDS